MRVPANLIKTNYTAGKEYMYLFSYKEYQGYYYEINNKFYVGKTYNSNSKELVKIELKNINTLLTQASTYVYGLVSGIKSSQLSSPKFNSFPKTDLDTDTEGDETYYTKKLNVNPTIIKQINKETFDKLKQDPFYQVISLKPDRSNLDQADKQMPGLKSFLLG
jgi:hypothetical protein